MMYINTYMILYLYDIGALLFPISILRLKTSHPKSPEMEFTWGIPGVYHLYNVLGDMDGVYHVYTIVFLDLVYTLYIPGISQC